MRSALASLVLAGACALVLAGGGNARLSGKPDLTGVIKAMEDAEKAETRAFELATPQTAAKANAEFAQAERLLDSAIGQLGKQPVNDYEFEEIRNLIWSAEGSDHEFQMDGYGESKDDYEFHRAEDLKATALWAVRKIADGHGPPVVLDTVTNDITTAFTAEDRAREAWKKHDADKTRTELLDGRRSLDAAVVAIKRAARQHQISGTEAEKIERALDDASTADGNAYSFVDPTSRYHDDVIKTIESGISAKDKAVTALEHAIANPPKTTPGESPLELTLSAVFVPGERATKYTAAATDKDSNSIGYTWKLRLIRIDAQGSSPPGFQSKDPKAANYSSAAFDATCNNAQLPTGFESGKTSTAVNYVWSNLTAEFTWYHGDVGSYAGSSYGCDHTKMGARGHQGTVTVIAHAGVWTCRAEIYGSNLTETPEQSPPATCARG